MIIPRSEWSPEHGRGHQTPRAQTRVVIHHAPERPIPANPTREQVATQLRIIEDWHAERLTPSNPRIGYQFVAVDQTAEIWEGLGWDRIGAHVGGHNTVSLGILILGIDGDRSAGRPETWAAISELIREGIRLGHLAPADQLLIEPHRARVRTTCPGNALAAFVERLTVPELLAMRPPAPPKIPAPSGELAVPVTEPVAPEPPNLDKIIVPTPAHIDEAVRVSTRWDADTVRDGIALVEVILRGMQRGNVKQIAPAIIANVLSEWLNRR